MAFEFTTRIKTAYVQRLRAFIESQGYTKPPDKTWEEWAEHYVQRRLLVNLKNFEGGNIQQTYDTQEEAAIEANDTNLDQMFE